MRVETAGYSATPGDFSRERRDCCVRALRIAAVTTYEDAHRALKAHGRIDGRGTYNITARRAAAMWALMPVDTFAAGLSAEPTLAQFARAYPTGRFLIRINTHFVAMVDGVLHNWRRDRDGVRSRVKAAWGQSSSTTKEQS